ncbi:50S ribosomal protein L25/general stress protein Ctc [Rickettsia endosymbiont of Halotydeus destructor]|uniref:50S ribosomal protein L25/general stress protein Ctc n=1 Tax=Rickettsia endosymbiont of Halotydeus destructor TaxID=2996754 RepID=UPI003BAF103E
MSEILELAAEVRSEFGTGAARELRRTGRVPAIIYGANKTPVAISIEEKEITKYYRKPAFISGLININVGETQYKVLPKAVELHPVTDIVRHVDFVFLEEKTQKMAVPVVYEGKERALGVKRGGYFNIIKRTIPMLCDVNNIPRNITIDVTNMPIATSIKSSNVKLPEGCQFATKKEFVLATIIGRRGKTEAEEGATPAEAAAK